MLRDRTIRYAVRALILIAACSLAHNAFAGGNVQGTSCSSGVSAGNQTGADSDGNNLVCVSGTWQYPAYTMQGYSGSAGASCSGYPAGAVHYNTTISSLEFCNGTNWDLIAAGSTSCGTPSGLSFTNLTGQSLGVVATNATPATITFSGCTSALSVSVSGVATGQISINGGAWVTSGSIASGQTLNVRMTTSISVSTTLTATVTVGSTSTNWTTTTHSASLQVFQTANNYIPSQLGSVSGGDTVCASEAAAAGYAGTYKAILSSDTVSAASHLTLSYPIVNAYNGSTVATSNLWSGTLSNVITNPSGGATNANGYGSPIISTGTNADGSISTGNTCNSWTSSSGNVTAGQQTTSGNWADGWNGLGGYCGSSQYGSLYCIQQ
jgi:hypothetical protein